MAFGIMLHCLTAIFRHNVQVDVLVEENAILPIIESGICVSPDGRNLVNAQVLCGYDIRTG